MVGEPGDHTPPPTIFDDGGGEKFWSLPKSQAIMAVREIHRERGQRADGLPSGHVTTAATLSFGIAMLFGGFRFMPFAIVWTLTMALSRMYLGRHFLADVLLGAVIGVLCVLFSIWITRSFRKAAGRQSWVEIAMIGVVASATAFFPAAELDHLGELAGLCVGVLLIIGIGVPKDDAP